jgi:cation diffusion facilitator CzcD-associated flavoprotein CzcO
MASPPQSPPSGVASVAVIGAGISGVCSAAYALREGLSVTVFDRSTIAGGVWHYDERKAEEPPYPNEKPSEGDYRLSQPGERRYPTPPPGDGETKAAPPSDTDRIRFSPPGPCYA